jgi:hypothetical protein
MPTRLCETDSCSRSTTRAPNGQVLDLSAEDRQLNLINLRALSFSRSVGFVPHSPRGPMRRRKALRGRRTHGSSFAPICSGFLLATGRHTSRPHPEHKLFPYLLRTLSVVRPDQGHHGLVLAGGALVAAIQQRSGRRTSRTSRSRRLGVPAPVEGFLRRGAGGGAGTSRSRRAARAASSTNSTGGVSTPARARRLSPWKKTA